jgi:hypothetical protein
MTGNNDGSIARASSYNNTMMMMGNNDASNARESTDNNTMTMANNNASDTRHNNSIAINATSTASRYNQVRFPREIRAKNSSEDSSDSEDSDDEVIADTLEYKVQLNN